MKKIISVLVIVMLTSVLALTASAKTVLKGDVDMNGKITASDARTTLRTAARLETMDETQIIIADVTGDGKVTASDARTILRCAASIEKNLGTVEIEDASSENNGETTTQAPVVKTELSSGIGMNYKDFISKFGGMRKVGTTDGTTEYTNDQMTIISDPQMIYSGNVSSIIITGGDYTLNGVFTGMTKSDAVNALKEDKWTVKDEDSSSVILTKNAMLMELTLSDGTVTKVEYCFAQSLLSPDERPVTETTTQEEPTAETTTKEEPTAETTTKEEPTAETTTKEEPTAETTTKEEPTAETTTKEEPTAETTTKEEPTTEEPTTQPSPGGNVTYEELPEQVKSFLEGTFGIIGYNYSEGKKNAVSMYVTPENVKAGMGLDSGNETISLDILIKDINGDAETYLIVPETNQYCEFSTFAMNMLGIKPEDLKIDFDTGSTNYDAIVKTNEKSAGVDYVVYTVDTGTEYCKIFTIDDNIKRIETYNVSDGVLKTRIDVETFLCEIPAGTFSLDGYQKKSFVVLFGSFVYKKKDRADLVTFRTVL